jgi:hypothetical protein
VPRFFGVGMTFFGVIFLATTFGVGVLAVLVFVVLVGEATPVEGVGELLCIFVGVGTAFTGVVGVGTAGFTIGFDEPVLVAPTGVLDGVEVEEVLFPLDDPPVPVFDCVVVGIPNMPPKAFLNSSTFRFCSAFLPKVT